VHKLDFKRTKGILFDKITFFDTGVDFLLVSRFLWDMQFSISIQERAVVALLDAPKDKP
jgi:hypothetical protein